MNGDRVSIEEDRRRFADVVMPHLGDAYALAHWLTGDAADADDVVQDASLRAFRAIIVRHLRLLRTIPCLELLRNDREAAV